LVLVKITDKISNLQSRPVEIKRAGGVDNHRAGLKRGAIEAQQTSRCSGNGAVACDVSIDNKRAALGANRALVGDGCTNIAIAANGVVGVDQQLATLPSPRKASLLFSTISPPPSRVTVPSMLKISSVPPVLST